MDLNFSLVNTFNSSDVVSCLAFSNHNTNNTNTLLATATNDKFITIYQLQNQYDIPTLHKSFAYKFHLQGINKLKFNSDSTLLASGANDLSVNLFDMEKQSLFRNFTTESIVTSLDINYASNLLIIGAYENYVSLYDIRSRNLIAKMIAHSEPITSVVFSEDSSIFISTSYDSFCRIWDVFKFSCLKTHVLENSPPINSCCLMPNQNYIMLNAFEGRNEIINLETEEEVKKFTGNKHTNFLIDSAIYKRRNGNYHIICGDEDGNICNWDVLGKDICKKYNVNEKYVINSLDWTEGVVACAGLNDESGNIYILKEEVEESNKMEIDGE